MNVASASGKRSVTTAMYPGVWLGKTRTGLRRLPSQSSGLDAAAAGVTTMPTNAVAVSGNWRRRPLQNLLKFSAAKKLMSPRACQLPKQPYLSLLPNRRNWAQGETMSSDAPSSSKLSDGRTYLQSIRQRWTDRSAPMGVKHTPIGPEAPVVSSQPTLPKHIDLSHLNHTASLRSRGHRSPRQPSHRCRRKVNTPSAVRGFIAPNRRSSRASRPGNIYLVLG